MLAAAGALVVLAGVGLGAGYALGAPLSATPARVSASLSSPSSASSPSSPGASRSTRPLVAAPRVTPSRPVPKQTVAASLLRTCSIASAAKDPRLFHFEGSVVNAKTGETLFDRHGSTGSRTASVLKVLTSAAALHVLGPDYRLTTRVVRGSKPGQVVLIGGGDVTLSRTPAGTKTAYAGAPHLATLAARVKAAWASDPTTRGTRITQVVLDSSYFGGPVWQPSWDDVERRMGTTPRITALMVDGDRANPAAETSPRGLDPIGRAGTAFANLVGSGVATTRGTAPAGAQVLGSVHSQPVSTLVKQALLVSDNTIAEALARVTAIRSGDGNTFAAEQAGTVGALAAYGIDTTGMKIKDGSGLSPDNRVKPASLSALFIQVLHRAHGLGAIYDGLPVAGRTGTLAYPDRFTGAAARARGQVRAKTGWIDTGYMLSGLIHSRDGTWLTFAFMAVGPVHPSTKTALDALTADAWDCGANLSNR